VLLDRKRVKFWQKWVFGFMAVIMAAFLVMIPITRYSGCGSGSSTASALEQINKDIAKYQAQTTANPADADAWLNLAEGYVLRANQQAQGSAAQKADWMAAIAAYKSADRLLRKEKGLAAKQKRLDNLQQLSTVYLDLQDYAGAVKVYQLITALRPKDAQAFFDLATIAINAGDKATAMLAFTRFLQLDPTSPDAAAVKDWLTQATAKPTPSPTATASPAPSPSSSGATP
jgi:tetratricopeptide (TPR) repeat protein